MNAARLLTWPATLAVPVMGTDEYGDPAAIGADLSDILCQAFPSVSTEDTESAQVGSVEWTVYMLPDVPATATSRLQLQDGPTLEFTGPPKLMRHPRARSIMFLELPAKVVE